LRRGLVNILKYHMIAVGVDKQKESTNLPQLSE
jgi:hypothetical protein